MDGFRGANLVYINRHIIPILKKNLDVMILHFRTNDQNINSWLIYSILKVFFNVLPNYNVTFMQPTLQLDSGNGNSSISK